MTQITLIEWCTMSWNPIRGCTRVSAGCEHCYAECLAARFIQPGLWAEGYATKVDGSAHWTGKVSFIPHKLTEPSNEPGSERIFVNSMSDLFHEALPYEDIDKIFSEMALCTWHTFLVLTKRPENMRAYVERVAASRPGDAIYRAVFDRANDFHGGMASWPIPHAQLGVSVESADTLHRLDTLRGMPNALPWVSLEPLLGPVDIRPYLDFLKWVVVGGESGPGSRPMQLEWVRAARDACKEAGVPFFFQTVGRACSGRDGRDETGREKSCWAIVGWQDPRRISSRAK